METMNVALSTAIQAHIESQGLDIKEAPLMCCETLTARQIKKFFRKTREITLTSVVLFSKWLIYAVDYPEEKRARFPAVISERLAVLSVVDYESTSLYQMRADTGLSISGIVSGGGEVGSIFLGLGPEPAAVALRAAIKSAVSEA
jgi:hypothetical protein